MQIPANRESLSAKSPFFAAMLRTDTPMQEVASGRVMLPTGSVHAVKSLVGLMHSNADDAMVDLMDRNLSPEQFLEVLTQAHEWQCMDIVKKLLGKVEGKLRNADVSMAAPFLKLASYHVEDQDRKVRKAWLSILDLAADRFAKTCAGSLASLEQLPFAALQPILIRNSLDTGDNEGQVLVMVAKWMHSHGADKIPDLLEYVRFPLLRLASLDGEEKAALRSLREQAGPQVQRLLGEALALQTRRKRPREADEEASHREESSEKKRRATPRRGGAGIPVLNEEELGRVLCEAIL